MFLRKQWLLHMLLQLAWTNTLLYGTTYISICVKATSVQDLDQIKISFAFFTSVLLLFCKTMSAQVGQWSSKLLPQEGAIRNHLITFVHRSITKWNYPCSSLHPFSTYRKNRSNDIIHLQNQRFVANSFWCTFHTEETRLSKKTNLFLNQNIQSNGWSNQMPFWFWKRQSPNTDTQPQHKTQKRKKNARKPKFIWYKLVWNAYRNKWPKV